MQTTPLWFKSVFYGVHVVTLSSLPLLLIHGLSTSHVAALFTLLAAHLLLTSAVTHRYIAHRSYTISSRIIQCVMIALSQVTVWPYSAIDAGKRHQFHHTYYHHHRLHNKNATGVTARRYIQIADDSFSTSTEALTLEKDDVDKCGAPIPSHQRILTPLDCSKCLDTIQLIDYLTFWLREADDYYQDISVDNTNTNTNTNSNTAHPSTFIPLSVEFIEIAILHKYFYMFPLIFNLIILFMTTSIIPTLCILLWTQVIVWHLTTIQIDHGMALVFRGYQIYNTVAAQTSACNNLVISLLTMGGCYLNTHHCAPQHAHHGGTLTGEVDVTYYFIRLLQLIGLVTHIHSEELLLLEHELRFPNNYLYIGGVSHTRLWPFYHRFEYPVMFVMIQLNEWTDCMMDRYWLWTTRQTSSFASFNIVSFRATDYLNQRQVKLLLTTEVPSLIPRIYDNINNNNNDNNNCIDIYLMTNWRYLNYTFNPISYYLIYDRSVISDTHKHDNNNNNNNNHAIDHQRGELIGMISEVHNTPWNEKCYYVHPIQPPPPQHIYKKKPSQQQQEQSDKKNILLLAKNLTKKVLSNNNNNNNNNNTILSATKPYTSEILPFYDYVHKKMHVSPFMAMDYIYSLRFGLPLKRWDVRWQMHHTQQNKNGTYIQTNHKEKPFTFSFDSTQPDYPAMIQSDHNIETTHNNTDITCQQIQQIRTTDSSFINSNVRNETAPSELLLNKHFKALLYLNGIAINDLTLYKIMIQYPLQTFRVFLLIYYQATILFFQRKARFYSHPE